MFLKQEKCKICSSNGATILDLKFKDKNIIKFFRSEYDEKTSTFLKKKIGNKNFILKRCKKCQFIWQKNVPQKKFLEKIYDQIIDPNEKIYISNGSRKFKKNKKNQHSSKKIF